MAKRKPPKKMPMDPDEMKSMMNTRVPAKKGKKKK